MPPRIMPPSDWVTVVNHIARAQHQLAVMPRPPELNDAMIARTRELDEALRLLGFDAQKDQAHVKQVFAERIPPLGTRRPE
jgi:hypothetical protein